MRYSRVLILLALVGVLALSVTLATSGARPAPRAARAAAKFRPSLQSTLKQELRQLMAAQRQVAVVPPGDLPPAPAPCPVAAGGCSENPCVVFVQSVNQPVAVAADAVQPSPVVVLKGRIHLKPPVTVPTVPTAPGGLTGGRCTRRATPHTFRVSGP